MAVYKVPQDVEAEDKLLGPFSFRQFVYLIIAGVGAFIAWLLWNLSPFLTLIPVPVIAFFVILALPLRKDQPMEIYLLALIQFLLKPKRRLWHPDGIISLVQITLPQRVDVQRTKNLSEGEAVNRLSYLAEVMDTRGWATRGVSQPTDTSLTADVAAEAAMAEDVLDTSAQVSRSFDTLIEQHNQARKQEMLQRLQSPQTTPASTTNPYDQFKSPRAETSNKATPETSQADDTTLHYNPYPDAMQQHVIQPISRKSPSSAVQQTSDNTTTSASAITVSPDILNLANNQDLTISAIAREAKRIQEQEGDGEVVIPLR